MLNNMRGLGLRRRLLSAIGAGALYDRIEELERRCLSAETAVTAGTKVHEKERLLQTRLEHFTGLQSADRLIELDFPVTPQVRYGWTTAPHPELQRLLAAREELYREHILTFLPLVKAIAAISTFAVRDDDPHWVNDWLPAFDAISLYSFLVNRRPRRFFEIGSGTSTKFARRAIRDHLLSTTIVSIDPFPRSEIDALCDEVIRLPLELVPQEVFSDLDSDDILFFDGSHRAFQNSDATVFFTEILPKLKKGILVGIHDIFLPHDYPADWLKRYYNEQYLLASWLLGGTCLRVELPVLYCTKTPHLHALMDEFWKLPSLSGALHSGGILWFTVRARAGEQVCE